MKTKKEYNHFDFYVKTMEDPMPFGDNCYPQEVKDGYLVYRDGKKKRVLGTKEEYDENFRVIREQYNRFKFWLIKNPDPNGMYKSLLDDIMLLAFANEIENENNGK